MANWYYCPTRLVMILSLGISCCLSDSGSRPSVDPVSSEYYSSLWSPSTSHIPVTRTLTSIASSTTTRTSTLSSIPPSSVLTPTNHVLEDVNEELSPEVTVTLIIIGTTLTVLLLLFCCILVVVCFMRRKKKIRYTDIIASNN